MALVPTWSASKQFAHYHPAMVWDHQKHRHLTIPIFQGYNYFDVYYTCDNSEHSLEMCTYQVEYSSITAPIRLPKFWPGPPSPDYYAVNARGGDYIYSPQSIMQ